MNYERLLKEIEIGEIFLYMYENGIMMDEKLACHSKFLNTRYEKLFTHNLN